MAVCLVNRFLGVQTLLLVPILIASVLIAHGDERERLASLSIDDLSQIASGEAHNGTARWHATMELATRKDPGTKKLLIELLKDDHQSVRGAASWGLCQIGGQDAQDALLEFLRVSIASGDVADLTHATEAQKELPDKRALDLLIKSLDIAKDNPASVHFKKYAVEALGKIGNAKASLAVARQLDNSVDYSMSWDYLVLDSLKRLKGKEATDILVDYLGSLALKMKGQDLKQLRSGGGREARQRGYNSATLSRTISTLEAITGRKSGSGSREDVASDWKKWWESQK